MFMFYLIFFDAFTFLSMFFFFNDTATTESYTYLHTLSLHAALPIWLRPAGGPRRPEGAPGLGGEPAPPGRQSVAEPGAEGARHFLGRARLALPLSLAAAASGPGRDRLRRVGPALDADPLRLRRGGRRPRLRDPSRRGPARRRHLRDVPGSRGQPPALQPALRPQPFRAAAARLSRLHRHLPRPDPGVSRQGCGVQSDRKSTRLNSSHSC